VPPAAQRKAVSPSPRRHSASFRASQALEQCRRLPRMYPAASGGRQGQGIVTKVPASKGLKIPVDAHPSAMPSPKPVSHAMPITSRRDSLPENRNFC